MKLLRIVDLDQPKPSLRPILALVHELHDIYYDFIRHDQDESYSYEVNIFGGSSKARPPGIHASEISKCERVMVYSLMGTERRPDPLTTDVNMLTRFKLGHAVHSMLQNDWHRIAQKSDGRITFEDEVKIHPELGGKAEEWNLMSHCDGVITIWTDPDDDGVREPYVRIGLEIKTESGPQYDKLRKPRTDHLEQTCHYMAALDLPLMWVFYYNKSNSDTTKPQDPWLFQFDKKLWEDVLELRFARAQHMAENKELPPRSEGMPCSWCAYSYTCKPKKLQHKRPVQINRGMRRKI